MKASLKNFSLSSLAIIFILAISISSCKKEDSDGPGDVKVSFEYVFGSNALPWAINQTMLHPKTGDSLTFTTFAFYLTNVRLQNEDGSWWEEADSYHIICAACDDASSFTLQNVPKGTYVAMEYTLGVDSTRNVSGAQTGALSPANGMFWDWNTGYIMLKAEGSSPQSSTGAFTFHLGGFSGANNIVTKKATDFFGNDLTVNADDTPELVFLANPARLWHSSPSVSVTNTIHMPGAAATAMATDFYSNISFKEMR